MALSFSQLTNRLDRITGPIPLRTLARNLHELRIEPGFLRHHARFGTDSYRRNLLHRGPSYQVLLLCWRSGQRSPIHDHAGSACAVRVLHGAVTETEFSTTPEGLVYPTSTRHMSTGAICATFDEDIHQMSNLQPGDRDAITLHLYSPPLLTMGTYSLTDREVHQFTDPIHEFVEGGGI